ncbi:DinB family protein [Longimicrobium sp.]|uniref:DinB family protein n=1 Tax=Longimicrobium sp. TaxID=2029185 RepID=UPI002E31C0B4|nr:DinB family protein [Longimicrobium sp.]HEX6039475.1 DinB family protein [Longimicrobium sp.]
MYRRIDDFLNDWREETQTTLKVLRALTDASLEQRVTPEGRSAGRLAAHITETVPEMMGAAGLTGLQGETHIDPTPSNAAQIAEMYETAARSLAETLPGQWTDADLEGEVEMYGDRWSRGLTLGILVRHQAHHRGQLTVLMRQAGLSVPGCYGPAAEEWAMMGMPAMA